MTPNPGSRGGRPLDGITVVAVEHAVAGPVATRHLADLGARVVKVERVGTGDFARGYDDIVLGQACHFVWLNRNKESIELDISRPDGRAVLDRLIGQADVFLQNIGGPAARRAGIDAATVAARYPAVVAVEISGFGDGGPYADRPAYDLIVQAETGSIAITGTPGALAKPGVAIADIGAGMYAVNSVLAALYERKSTGAGRAISVSMFDVVAEWMSYSLYYSRFAGVDPEPLGIGTQAIVPYSAYPTSDGRQVVLGVQNEREWQRLCREVIGRPDLAEDKSLEGNGRRLKHREQIDRACAAAFGAMTLTEAQRRLDAARIANGVVRTVAEVVTHPQLIERGRYTTVETPAGPVPAIYPPPIVDGWSPAMREVPALGQHTESLLAEAGYSPQEIASLRSAAVIGAQR
jgi:itaconate CoA-transferase